MHGHRIEDLPHNLLVDAMPCCRPTSGVTGILLEPLVFAPVPLRGWWGELQLQPGYTGRIVPARGQHGGRLGKVLGLPGGVGKGCEGQGLVVLDRFLQRGGLRVPPGA